MRTFKNAFITGFGFMAGALTLAGIALWAQSLNTFTSGSVVSAGDLNANFTALNGRLDGLDTRVTAAEASITRIAPVGTILAWHKDLGGVPALPGGWVQCDGQTLSDADSLLNGQTIPNLNATGRFLRGSSTSGAFQTDTFQGHIHGVSPHSGTHVGEFTIDVPGSSGTDFTTQVANSKTTSPQNPPGGYPFGAPRFGSETRPTNMSVVWIMRVK